MSTRRMAGFQKRSRGQSTREVGMAIVRYTEGGVACSCGWTAPLRSREKVLEDSIDRHLRKRHGGAGLRL